MKQMSFLQSADPAPKKRNPKWFLAVDGASRGNPGKAGAGVYLTCEDEVILEQGFFLGEKTNNQAEYLALLIGLFYAKKYVKDTDSLHVQSDSQLLVRQMCGQYKVKDARLKMMRDVAYTFLDEIHSYEFEHVLRHKNTHADKMANHGVDKKIEVPKACANALKKYEVF